VSDVEGMLPGALAAWVEAVSGQSLRKVSPHFAGASREAWQVDVGSEADGRALFLLRDRGAKAGSARDAAVLAALASTPVPVPELIGWDASLSAILLERLPGRSDFPAVDREEDREPTARHLMELTATLHRLDPAALEIEHLSLPERPEACAGDTLEQARVALAHLGEAADPLFEFALGWLEREIPSHVERYCLVHSDMGPGNFLYEQGRVTGLVDWEVAHFGDPMEDLAAIAVRDIATPIGPLSSRFAEYEESGGPPVDSARVEYYRALVLTRNSLMIGLGLADPPPGFDIVEMTMYQTSLMRAAALVLCDALGVDRPLPVPEEVLAEGPLVDAVRRDLRGVVEPALSDPAALRRLASIERATATLDHAARVGARLDRSDWEDLGSVLEGGPEDRSATQAALRHAIREQVATDAGLERRVAGYLARRMERLAERRRPLMGPLAERRPQTLAQTLESS